MYLSLSIRKTRPERGLATRGLQKGYIRCPKNVKTLSLPMIGRSDAALLRKCKMAAVKVPRSKRQTPQLFKMAAVVRSSPIGCRRGTGAVETSNISVFYDRRKTRIRISNRLWKSEKGDASPWWAPLKIKTAATPNPRCCARRKRSSWASSVPHKNASFKKN